MHPLQYTYLTKPERRNPKLALSRFCRRNDLPHLRNQLWTWLRETLAADNTIYETAEARDELLHTYEEINRLLDAVYLFHESATSPTPGKTNLQRTYNEPTTTLPFGT